MAVTLYHTGRTPGQTQFGLDTFTDHYTSDSPAQVVMSDPTVPQKGDAHPTFSFMFLTDRHCSETPDKSSSLDLVYVGCIQTSMGSPVLPPIKHIVSDSVRSATTNTSSVIWPRVATDPCTVEYYAPTSEISLFSTASTSAVVCPDPSVVTSLITIDLVPGGTVPALGLSALAAWILANGFVQEIIETDKSTEIVAGQFWQITKTRTQTLFPWAPISGGATITLAAGGTNYVVSDTLTISSGGQSAILSVTAIDAVTGAVSAWSVTSNTFTTAQTGLSASGGSGSGAQFNVIIV